MPTCSRRELRLGSSGKSEAHSAAAGALVSAQRRSRLVPSSAASGRTSFQREESSAPRLVSLTEATAVSTNWVELPLLDGVSDATGISTKGASFAERTGFEDEAEGWAVSTWNDSSGPM